MKSDRELRKLLESIDHRGYPAYKELKGAYQFDRYILAVEHVQGDPFASPSQVSIVVDGRHAGIPVEYYEKRHKRVAAQDYILRNIGIEISKKSFQAKGSGKSGMIAVSRCGQEVLNRSACQINAGDGSLTIRIEVGFPANGRTINAKELDKILFNLLPEIVDKAALYANINKNGLRDAVQLAENQLYIRTELKIRKLAAFVADGSVLPRESGISSKPLKNAVKFKSPDSMKVTMDLPDGNNISGMGIPCGITLIVGGGYHGKSTLLQALETGVYDHIAGDGREYVIADPSAVKIRAEDGRSISGTNISMFIGNLPNKADTKRFMTENASGSTSQAANVIEALETGCGVLLIDEDTSATNFMIRDELMQLVVAKDKEPITPYIDRIRDLYEIGGISTILVAGSSGEYFNKADKVIQMDEYNAYDITGYAKEVADSYMHGLNSTPKKKAGFQMPEFDRVFLQRPEWVGERLKIKAGGKDCLSINKDSIDTRYLEQLADHEQLRMIGYIMAYMNRHILNKNSCLQDAVKNAYRLLEKTCFRDIIEDKYIPCDLAIPREQEVFMCINRLRKQKLLKNK